MLNITLLGRNLIVGDWLDNFSFRFCRVLSASPRLRIVRPRPHRWPEIITYIVVQSSISQHKGGTIFYSMMVKLNQRRISACLESVFIETIPSNDSTSWVHGRVFFVHFSVNSSAKKPLKLSPSEASASHNLPEGALKNPG